MKFSKQERNDLILKLVFLVGSFVAFLYFAIVHKTEEPLIKAAGMLSIFSLVLFGEAISKYLDAHSKPI